MNKFDKAVAQLENEGTETLWAIPIEVLIETFGLTSDKKHFCLLCKKEQKPLVGFTFVSKDNGRVVGYVCDHVDCNVNESRYNHSTMIHVDEDCEFNRNVRSLFKTMKPGQTYSNRCPKQLETKV